MSSKCEPAIWSHDTGQRIPCFDRCQLTITWMSNIIEGGYKSRLHFSVSLLAGVWSPAGAPRSNTASHDNHKNQFIGFLFFLIWVWGSAWRPLGPPVLRYNIVRALILPNSYWAIMNKILMFPRPCSIKWRMQFYFSSKISVEFGASFFCLTFGNVKIILNNPNPTSSLWLLTN